MTKGSAGPAAADNASPPVLRVLDAATEPMTVVRQLFVEYAEQLGVDLCFQGFQDELAHLPGVYAAPQGALLLASVDGVMVGCGAFKPLPESDYADACEMKRLYVKRAFRRFGLGRLLAEQLITQAVQAGYSTMLLDTLDDMESARGLYASLGFEEIPPYYYNPIPGAHYLKLDLTRMGSRF